MNNLSLAEMPHIFRKEITVLQKDIDDLDHVNNLVYLQWAQETSASHWYSVTPPKITNKFSWVILQQEAVYKKSIKINDKVYAETWVEEMSGVKSTRKIIIYANEKAACYIKIIWCMVDKKTLRPKRITEEIAEPYL